MLSVTIVSLKILIGNFCNCLSYENFLIMARYKELSYSQKALIVKLSPRFSRKLGRLNKQNPMVTREEQQEDLHESGGSVPKQAISNEMLKNGLKSRRPKKTLLLKRHRDIR